MIEQDDIEKLVEAQKKLKSSEVEEDYIPEILGSLVDSNPTISRISTSTDIQVTQKSEQVEIELQESVLETDEGREAVSELCKSSDATKKAITSTLILAEGEGEVTHEEIRKFSDYNDKSEISRACKELRDKNILGKDDSGEVDVV
ncbi:hypothetical protein [Candidatus Nanohalococcus occultus]|uniref:Uncharacterized protein n=1 Tax=Candidatus Nanohalococcus occultus TaxID=2978047 RepID=A0ABY8CE79_9ARCH|nr:hypothetical protein SVXNc_0497 [Candidatus Nanohaloarchaeota archaeon SVXNc]